MVFSYIISSNVLAMLLILKGLLLAFLVVVLIEIGWPIGKKQRKHLKHCDWLSLNIKINEPTGTLLKLYY